MKVRAINNLLVGKQREELYREAYKRIKIAKDYGFWLEIITICDSLIGDRLEALLAAINQQKQSFRKFRPIGTMLKDNDDKFEHNGLPLILINQLKEWAEGRNRLMHEMVKIREGETLEWDARILLAKNVAQSGVKLTRKVQGACRKIIKNRPRD